MSATPPNPETLPLLRAVAKALPSELAEDVDLGVDGDVPYLRYRPPDWEGLEEFEGEIRKVAGILAAVYKVLDYDAPPIRVITLAPYATPSDGWFTWRFEPEWARRYFEGDDGAEEVVARVDESFEQVTPPHL